MTSQPDVLAYIHETHGWWVFWWKHENGKTACIDTFISKYMHLCPFPCPLTAPSIHSLPPFPLSIFLRDTYARTHSQQAKQRGGVRERNHLSATVVYLPLDF